MIAASAGRDAIVSMLISLGADVNTTNDGGQTPLHYAASRNRYEVMHCSHLDPQNYYIKASICYTTRLCSFRL